MEAVIPASLVPSPLPHTRAIAENPALAARAAGLLQGFRTFIGLDADDARCVLTYMREVVYARGDVLYLAGCSRISGHLLLLVEGEVSVDTGSPTPSGEVPIAVLGPGSVLGQMSLLDGAPSSATCTAVTDIQAAGLGRRGLERLIDEHPKVGAKLLALLAQSLAERLRALDDQLRLYGQIEAAAWSKPRWPSA